MGPSRNPYPVVKAAMVLDSRTLVSQEHNKVWPQALTVTTIDRSTLKLSSLSYQGLTTIMKQSCIVDPAWARNAQKMCFPLPAGVPKLEKVKDPCWATGPSHQLLDDSVEHIC